MYIRVPQLSQHSHLMTGKLILYSLLYHTHYNKWVTKLINSIYGADASVLVQMNTESPQTTCIHCYKFWNPYSASSLVCPFFV